MGHRSWLILGGCVMVMGLLIVLRRGMLRAPDEGGPDNRSGGDSGSPLSSTTSRRSNTGAGSGDRGGQSASPHGRGYRVRVADDAGRGMAGVSVYSLEPVHGVSEFVTDSGGRLILSLDASCTMFVKHGYLPVVRGEGEGEGGDVIMVSSCAQAVMIASSADKEVGGIVPVVMVPEEMIDRLEVAGRDWSKLVLSMTVCDELIEYEESLDLLLTSIEDQDSASIARGIEALALRHRGAKVKAGEFGVIDYFNCGGRIAELLQPLVMGKRMRWEGLLAGQEYSWGVIGMPVAEISPSPSGDLGRNGLGAHGLSGLFRACGDQEPLRAVVGSLGD